MAESLVVKQWLNDVLKADAALVAQVGTRIYDAVAPSGAAMPYVVYQYMAGRDIAGVGPHRIMTTFVYIVKVVKETNSFASLEAAANRIDAVLQAASGINVRGTVVACVREAPFEMVESLETGQYRHLGGSYRFWAQ